MLQKSVVDKSKKNIKSLYNDFKLKHQNGELLNDYCEGKRERERERESFKA
jgi:hypothetical protein